MIYIKYLTSCTILALLATSTLAIEKASKERLDEVQRRGEHVMPFNLEQTTHIFTKTKQGGVQQLIFSAPTVWLIEHLNASFPRSLSDSVLILANFAGVMSASLFAVSLIFTLRTQWIDKLFMGLDRVFSLHHLIGSLAFLCLLAHSLGVIASHFILDPGLVINFILPNLNAMPLLAGWIALLILTSRFI